MTPIAFGDSIRSIGGEKRAVQAEHIDTQVCDLGFDGPFVFCDYWASVLGLKEVINPEALKGTGLSLEVFRKTLNRPAAALPRLGYFMLVAVSKPFVVPVLGLLRLFGYRRRRIEPYKWEGIRKAVAEHTLDLKRKKDGRVDVYFRDTQIASDIIDPVRIQVCCSMFLARYKVFWASLVALGYGALVRQVSDIFHAFDPLLPYLGVLSYPIVLLILWLMFDDILTAVIAPLPLIVIRRIVTAGHGFQGFVLAVVGIALVLYLVEWFFIPRSLPPALYLYVNDQQSQFFPYRKGHEPYWLEGKCYWVWRFVTLAPAELTKFWEKDWERLEVWVRADDGDRGFIEWIVTDWHYRELWFRYRRLVDDIARRIHRNILKNEASVGSFLRWIVEVDMDVVFHTPVVRSIYLVKGKGFYLGGRLISIFNSMFRRRPSEDPEQHKRRLESLEIQGSEFLGDVPEALRTTATRRLLSMPWSFWRFPRGVKSKRVLFLYGGTDDFRGEPEPASDPSFQIKAKPDESSPGPPRSC